MSAVLKAFSGCPDPQVTPFPRRPPTPLPEGPMPGCWSRRKGRNLPGLLLLWLMLPWRPYWCSLFLCRLRVSTTRLPVSRSEKYDSIPAAELTLPPPPPLLPPFPPRLPFPPLAPPPCPAVRRIWPESSLPPPSTPPPQKSASIWAHRSSTRRRDTKRPMSATSGPSSESARSTKSRRPRSSPRARTAALPLSPTTADADASFAVSSSICLPVALEASLPFPRRRRRRPPEVLGGMGVVP